MSRRPSGPPASDRDLAPEPERWSALRPDDDLRGKVGAGFRALAASPVPPVAALSPDRPARAALGDRRARGPFRLRVAWPALALATFGVVGIATGGAVAAVKVYRYLHAAPAIARRATVASAEPRNRHAPRRASPPDVAPPTRDGEATLLTSAFRSLRADHDPARALALLDEHDRQFPAGQLAGEAGVARVETLLALGRNREALGVLERQPDVAREHALLRGELRAEAGRCAVALADFTQAERATAGGTSRAVWDQATCRARLGDARGARRDFERYLRLDPNGPRAPEARRWLAAPATEDDVPSVQRAAP